MNPDEMTFEEAYEELVQVIEKLESGELMLEESVELYERGSRLSARCQQLLDNAELRISTLESDGTLTG